MIMFSIFAGFNIPEVMVPLSLLAATASSLIIWLTWTLIQLARNKTNPRYLFLKLILVNTVLFLFLYFAFEKLKYL